MRVAGKLTSHLKVNDDDVVSTTIGGQGAHGAAGDVMMIEKALNSLEPAPFCACIDRKTISNDYLDWVAL